MDPKNWTPESNDIGSAGHELREEKGENEETMEEKEEKEEQGQEKEKRKEPQKKVPLKPGATIKEKALALFATNYFLFKQERKTSWGQKMQFIRENTGNKIGRTFVRVGETKKQLTGKEKSWMRRKGVEYLGKNKEKRTSEEKKWTEEEIKELFEKKALTYSVATNRGFPRGVGPP